MANNTFRHSRPTYVQLPIDYNTSMRIEPRRGLIFFPCAWTGGNGVCGGGWVQMYGFHPVTGLFLPVGEGVAFTQVRSSLCLYGYSARVCCHLAMLTAGCVCTLTRNLHAYI